MTTSESKAFLENRYSPSIFDVQSLVKPILSHRLKLNISAKSENINIEEILDDVINHIKIKMIKFLDLFKASDTC